MSYIEHSLTDDERVLAEGCFHWIHTAGMVFSALTIVLIPLALVMLVERLTTELAVTSRRLVLKKGWIARKTEEISLARIEEVNLRQSVLGRVLGYGTLLCAGVGVGQIATVTIREPMEFRKAILYAQESASDR